MIAQAPPAHEARWLLALAIVGLLMGVLLIRQVIVHFIHRPQKPDQNEAPSDPPDSTGPGERP